jgi:DNA-binding CsgD family transcriptional regulator
MPEPDKPSLRALQRLDARQRRLLVARGRQDLFDLVASGYSHERIAREMNVSVATVRREVDRVIAARQLDAPEKYVHLQVARLNKALERVVSAVEADGIKAVGPLMKLIAQLDRYHGLAGPAPLPPPARPLGLPAPAPARLALTHTAPTSAVEAEDSEFPSEESRSTRELDG